MVPETDSLEETFMRLTSAELAINPESTGTTA
jgi:hypothetical protein